MQEVLNVADVACQLIASANGVLVVVSMKACV